MTRDNLAGLRDFLKNFVAEMPDDAKNPMCWRVEASMLYNAYKQHCFRYHLGPPVAGQLFVDEVKRVFPKATLSGWRWLFGLSRREFDGIMLIKLPPRGTKEGAVI